jgi:hypothetical protein
MKMKASTLTGVAGLVFAFCATGAFAATPTADPAPPAQGTAAPAMATHAAPELHKAMRALWHGHIVHTRAYAEAVKAGNTAAAKKAADETVANAKEIAHAVAGFYGEDAGKSMLDLLAGHWMGVQHLTDATHKGDTAAEQRARQELDANAADVAKFLSGANPNLPYDAVHGLMMAHIGYHEAQIREIMDGDRKAEATTWTSMQEHMNMFADALSDGIARQFPEKAK